jgi:diadenosine tetraphosphate (Ap4A) HIT family hydrolase
MTDLKTAQEQGVAPWNQLVSEQITYMVYRDAFPVTQGHLLFVPKINNTDAIMDCYRAAHKYGEWAVIKGAAEGYNVGMNQGKAAGQTVMYPHVHMIPRRAGDCEDPVGGVRGVVPGQANYRQSGYQLPA